MLAITQFEVYVLQQGRWTIHARYPGEERQEAVLDARTTEHATGFPTKVIRETYFPDVNDSERITAYISPKAKAHDQAHKMKANERRPFVAARAVASKLGRKVRPLRRGRAPLSVSQTIFRVVVTAIISLAAATLLTGVLAWALHRAADGGVEISAEMRSGTLTYGYILTFLFFFWSLFRSRLPLHRLLSDLWQKAAKPAEVAVPVAGAKPPKVKPKHNREASPEILREYEDMKIKRGDLDMLPPEPVLEELTPVVGVLPEPVPGPIEEEKPAEKIEKKAKEKRPKVVEAVEPPPVLEAEPAATPAAEAPQTAPESTNLERMVLRRFASDVVKPAVKEHMPDDPVTRRGVAIVLAGSASAVAATSRLSQSTEMDLLKDALTHIGMNQGAVDLFMSQHEQLVGAPANVALRGAGRSAIAAYLEGGTYVAQSLGYALATWRTPFGSVQAPSTEAESANTAIVPLIDVYLLTELREKPASGQDETVADAQHDQAMGTHNNVVRACISAHQGHEVKHTGKGIFARFPTAAAAYDAAVDAQRAFNDDDSKLAIGIVGNTSAGEDPLLSAHLVRQAQAIVARTGTGEILCEAQVQAAIHRLRGDVGAPAAEELNLVRLAVPERDATPEPDFEATAGHVTRPVDQAARSA
jgi:adenylate cyclase